MDPMGYGFHDFGYNPYMAYIWHMLLNFIRLDRVELHPQVGLSTEWAHNIWKKRLLRELAFVVFLIETNENLVQAPNFRHANSCYESCSGAKSVSNRSGSNSRFTAHVGNDWTRLEH